MKRLKLKPGRERSVQKRHPWIFSGALAESDAQRPDAGELVEVASAAGAVLGHGWYSPQSQIRVRMLDFRGYPAADELAGRVAAAITARSDLLAGGYTNAVRLVNAESDGLPGVVVDFYNGFAVCQLTCAGAERRRDALTAALRSALPECRGVSVRQDLKDREREGLPVEPVWLNLQGEEPPELIEIREGECRLLVDVRNGHKTGGYLDQREARALVGTLAKGREVLNCFSYTGGFGLFARAGGARKVTQVDISEAAIALAKRNADLSEGAGTEMEYAVADVFEYLRKCRDSGRRFDLIVLDPPKFAASRSQVMKAARGYKDINLLAMKLLRPGGYLATFSCSGAMTSELFDQVLQEASVDAARTFQVIARTRQAADHPVALTFPEGFYLKGVVLRAAD